MSLSCRHTVRMLKALPLSSILATWSAHLNPLDLITLTILSEWYKLWSSLLWSLFHFPFSSSWVQIFASDRNSYYWLFQTYCIMETCTVIFYSPGVTHWELEPADRLLAWGRYTVIHSCTVFWRCMWGQKKKKNISFLSTVFINLICGLHTPYTRKPLKTNYIIASEKC